MSILVSKSTRVITQGITGTSGLFHSQQCRAYAAECQPGVDVFVGGVTPGKGGTTVDGFAVFNSVIEARAKTGANTSMVFVPPPFCADAILEAADAGNWRVRERKAKQAPSRMLRPWKAANGPAPARRRVKGI